ncbi:MAG: MSCRAMM family protein [Planctomycetota bacterium]|jgi:hypothetical protein
MRFLLLLTLACGLAACNGSSEPGAPDDGVAMITGTVTGDLVEDIEISLSGPVSRRMRTDAAGSFQFADLPPGDYVVTPSTLGVAFEPTQASVQMPADGPAVELSFSASMPVPVPAPGGSGNISGTITGDVWADLGITLSGPVLMTTVTDSNGVYSFAGLPAGVYTIVPSRWAVFFTPPLITVTSASDSIGGNDFVATVAPAPPPEPVAGSGS